MSALRKQHQDEFEKTLMIGLPGASRRLAYMIRCCRCEETDKVSLARNQPMPPDVTARRFNARGWDTGKGRRDKDFCQACSKALSSPNRVSLMQPAKPIVEPVQAVSPLPATVSAPALAIVPTAPPRPQEPQQPQAREPREMTRDDKRLIFGKLNEVYLDEKVGYSGGWGDGRVSIDLGVPLEWVRSVRDENFGPDTSSEEIRGLLEQAKTCSKDVHVYMRTMEGIRTGIENLHAQMKKIEAERPGLLMQITRIDTHMGRISKQLGIG